VVDLPTLDILRAYRGDLDTTEPLPFGVYGEVLEGGRVAVGDPVELER
jgi:MOSC domain-containing protein YiiM